MNELFVFYTLLISIFILAGVLIIVIQYLINIIKQNKSYEKDIESIKKDIFSDSQRMLNEVIEKALREETFKSSGEIATQLLRAQKEELEKARNEFFEEYKKRLVDLQKDNINIFRNISKDIEAKAGSEMEDFKEILEKETVESQKIVGEKIENRYQEVQKDLEEYKSRELQKLKDNINKITQNAIELAIGRSLDREAHENLVMEALREAIEKQDQEAKII